MVKELSQLLEIEVSDCISMKNIVFMESIDNGKTTDKIEFIRLCSLTLRHLPTIDNFYSSDIISSTIEVKSESLRTDIQTSFFNAKVSFPNLETLRLSAINLSKIWNDDQLFLACYSFQNLVNLIVNDCSSLKYLFSPSMVESLKNLKQLQIKKCEMMEEIIATKKRNNDVASEEVRFSKLEKIIVSDMKNLKTVWHNQFEGLKTLEVKNCEKLENIFQSCYVQKALQILETLKVRYCPLVEKIFKLNANHGMHREEDATHLKNLILVGLPKMKQIWSRDPHGTLRFFNLQVVEIEECENLDYLFPFSIAKNLLQLEDLRVYKCGIKEVIGNQEGAMEGTVTFELNHLISLAFLSLHKLRVFYPGLHTLECRSLRTLWVSNCNKLMVFKMQSQESSPPHKLHYPMQQPLIADEQVIPDLEYLEVINALSGIQLFDKDLHVFGFANEKAYFPNWILRNISNLETLDVEPSSFTKIFEDERSTSQKIQIKSHTTRLKYLRLHSLPQLQHICKEGFQIDPLLDFLESITIDECSSLINLVPPYISFNHLTKLEVAKCNELITLISSSTAKGLVKLKRMMIRECNSLEQVVVEEEGGTQDEIVFNNLEVLELQCLRRLIMFCSSQCPLRFPLLKKIVMKQCPKMKFFFKNRINTNPSFRHLELQESNVLLSGNILQALSNLEKLEVRKCESLEAVFDLEGISNRGTLVKEIIPLKEITLSNLAKLRHIWKYDSQEIVICGNSGDDNGNILQALSNLEKLEVRECDSLEAVFDLGGMSNRGTLVKETIIPLKEITLSNLAKLKHIWKYDSQEIVTSGNSGDDDGGGDYEGLKMSQPRGTESKGEKVIPNLEILTLEKRYANMIMQTQYSQSQNLFNKLKHLRLYDYEDDKSTFPYWFLHNIPKLENLFVQRSSFEVIFDEKQIEINTRIKCLGLYNLDELQTICQEGSKIGPVLEAIEILNVHKCSNLKHLVPSSLTFSHLRKLYVKECNGLIDLFTSSIARSLINLTKMKITKCNSLEQVVAEEGDDRGDDIVVSNLKEDITFASLKDLELRCLSSFKSFCSGKHTLVFPFLKYLTSTGCPKMQNFSLGVIVAPMLTIVEFENGTKRLKGDLNTTVNQLFMEKQEIGMSESKKLDIATPISQENGVKAQHLEEEEEGNAIMLMEEDEE